MRWRDPVSVVLTKVSLAESSAIGKPWDKGTVSGAGGELMRSGSYHRKSGGEILSDLVVFAKGSLATQIWRRGNVVAHLPLQWKHRERGQVKNS
jgi:hypothetical protein